MKKDLTVIIVTFNSSAVIEKCLEHLDAQKYDIIIVDNASSDNTCQIISEKFPLVDLIKSEKNLGYGRANNIGLRKAQTEFSLILNPDAYLFDEDIQISLKILKENPKIALASPLIMRSEDGARKQHDGKPYKLHHFIVGGVLFMRMKLVEKIGFFNEEFFMFAEDNELSDRSVAAGYQNAIINFATAYHIGGSSSKKSLRTTYRRYWHLGWSKSKYRTKRKGRIDSARATLRLSIVYLGESLWNLFKINQEKSVAKFAFAAGCFSYLIGLKAFKKDGSPRG